MNRAYYPRLADGELESRLKRIGAVLIEGPKGCGKTETASRQAGSQIRLDTDPALLETALAAPFNVLAGPTPRLVDEWQLAPGLWNAVRREVDARQLDGQFILTGSATPHDDSTRHSGAGRFSRLRMRTMTLAESDLSTKSIPLRGVLAGEPVTEGRGQLSLNDLIDEACHGGWPGDRARPTSAAMENVADYVEEIAFDIRLTDAIRRDSTRVRAVMRAIARNTASEATLVTLAKDTLANGVPLNDDTAGLYLGALERLMVYEPVPAWSPALRSRTRVRTRPKHHFTDPAMSVALLGATPAALRLDIRTFGFIFESLAVRDLRAYSAPLGGAVFHYRDQSGLEVDAIVQTSNAWAAFEIKLGTSTGAIDKAAASLLAFNARIDTQSSGRPAALAVITATGFAYTRPDGVAVIPLSALT
ncbi:MAG: DUF4143 domain-containing protein [Bifidobacteriaceae bacterium]|jgi:predicted AAA+ superfamily ATPase|nr:DUF4143 domain-containing protein [Bifidobacteriaceae bacterium]